METGGSLTIVDHLLDTRDTRFGDVSALEVMTHEGTVYVIAGGGDDGITMLQMLPDGQLVTRATIADTTDMTLDNVSAIVARGNGDSLDIFVTSASEDGITHLRYDIGAPGQTLIAATSGNTLAGGTGGNIVIGGIGNDRLTGGQGDDIIRDGGGIDVMTGGAGADIFVLASDGDRETIMDFEIGVDSIDLSAWPMLRSRDQLTMAMTATGFTITYGDEVLVIHSSTGTTTDHRTLTTDDLMGGARIPQVILPGFAGPVWGTPALPTRTDIATGTTTGTASVPNTGATVEGIPSLAGTVQIGGLSFLRHQFQPATGRVAFGSMTRDGMRGTDGNDVLVGRGGNDRMEGGDGYDRLDGGYDADRLYGGAGRTF
ncbi:MAG: Ca2+-binding RTX toxin-like protein [Sulfitobacter pontiacus]